MKNNLYPIAKSGIPYVTCSFVGLLLFFILDLELLSFISFIITVFFIFIFRNPERVLPHFGQSSVVSPADGIVISIKELDESEYYRYKIEIDGSCFSPSLLRVPFSASVKDIKLTKGAKLSNRYEIASKLNENLSVVFEDSDANQIKIIHTLKRTFLDIQSDIIKKQKLYQGARYATMINGVTTLYLPQNFRLSIKEGNELKASESLIGYFS